MRRTRLVVGSAPAAQQGACIRMVLTVLAHTYLPLLFIAIALSAFVLSRETYRRRLAWLAALACSRTRTTLLAASK
jgi:hypothetical protein